MALSKLKTVAIQQMPTAVPTPPPLSLFFSRLSGFALLIIYTICFAVDFTCILQHRSLALQHLTHRCCQTSQFSPIPYCWTLTYRSYSLKGMLTNPQITDSFRQNVIDTKACIYMEARKWTDICKLWYK